MNGDVPESTRRYARENREQLEYILRHGSSIEIRSYAGALLIRGLPDPEVELAQTTGETCQHCGETGGQRDGADDPGSPGHRKQDPTDLGLFSLGANLC
jgi:hypothetical protein